jgi:hypothetical protein
LYRSSIKTILALLSFSNAYRDSPMRFCLKVNNHENYRAQNVRPARKYVETHGPEIIKELYQLARELEKMMKE